MYNTLFIYLFLVAFLYCSFYVAGRNSLQKVKVPYGKVFIPLLCVSIVLGGRYDVGTDWANYKYIFDFVDSTDLSESELEPLYILLNRVVAFWGLSSSYFFTLVSLIHLTLIYNVFKGNPRILSLGILFFLLCLLPMSLNIVRQSIAICVFLYGIKFIETSPWKYVLTVIVAGLFHYSAFILLPLCLLRNNFFTLLNNRYISLGLFVITSLLGTLLIAPILSILPIDLLNAKYQNSLNNSDIEMTVNSGLGVMINNLLNACILFCLPILKRFPEKETFLLIVYRFFLVGVIFTNIFGVSEYLSRLILPMVSLKIILLPFIVYGLIHTSKKYEFFGGIAILFSYILLFIFSVLNNAGGITPFCFKWV